MHFAATSILLHLLEKGERSEATKIRKENTNKYISWCSNAVPVPRKYVESERQTDMGQ